MLPSILLKVQYSCVINSFLPDDSLAQMLSLSSIYAVPKSAPSPEWSSEQARWGPSPRVICWYCFSGTQSRDSWAVQPQEEKCAQWCWVSSTRCSFILYQRPTAIAFLPLSALLFASGTCFPLFSLRANWSWAWKEQTDRTWWKKGVRVASFSAWCAAHPNRRAVVLERELSCPPVSGLTWFHRWHQLRVIRGRTCSLGSGWEAGETCASK